MQLTQKVIFLLQYIGPIKMLPHQLHHSLRDTTWWPRVVSRPFAYPNPHHSYVHAIPFLSKFKVLSTTTLNLGGFGFSRVWGCVLPSSLVLCLLFGFWMLYCPSGGNLSLPYTGCWELLAYDNHHCVGYNDLCCRNKFVWATFNEWTSVQWLHQR